MIKPNIGRVVWFFPNGHQPEAQPHSAQIAYVHNDRLVNLGVIDQNGNPYSATSVTLLQDDDAVPQSQHAQWMPYQVGQAKKHEPETETPSTDSAS